jgi:two-component system response regulator RegA
VSASQGLSILVVDDDDAFRTRLGRALRERGLVVTMAADADQALAEARLDPPELAIVDLKMPGRTGLELVRDLVALDAGTRIVVLTGYGSIVTAVEAVKLGARNYLTKPADTDQILAAFGDLEPGTTPTDEISTPTLARTEWEHIQRTLQDCGGNISEAARRLGVHRRSLQRKLSKAPPRT